MFRTHHHAGRVLLCAPMKSAPSPPTHPPTHISTLTGYSFPITCWKVISLDFQSVPPNYSVHPKHYSLSQTSHLYYTCIICRRKKRSFHRSRQCLQSGWAIAHKSWASQLHSVLVFDESAVSCIQRLRQCLHSPTKKTMAGERCGLARTWIQKTY